MACFCKNSSTNLTMYRLSPTSKMKALITAPSIRIFCVLKTYMLPPINPPTDNTKKAMPTNVQRASTINSTPATTRAASSAHCSASGCLLIFDSLNTVPSIAACTSCGNTLPAAVASGCVSPAAVGPTNTIPPAKSSGKSTALTLLLR